MFSTKFSQAPQSLKRRRSSSTEPTTAPASSFQPSALLEEDGKKLVRMGVDFGTGNSCATLVLVDKDSSPISQWFTKIQALHAQDNMVRFPTLIAVRPVKINRRVSGTAELIFASAVLDNLKHQKIQPSDIVWYPKLGLVDPETRAFHQDKESVKMLHDRHKQTISTINSFKEVKVAYPGMPVESLKLPVSIEDIVVVCLRYFLALMRRELRKKFDLTSEEEVDFVLSRKTNLSFAAPTFWDDTTLAKFSRLIDQAGWPSCHIWSEPKCAVAAYLMSKILDVGPSARKLALSKQKGTERVVVDIGAGTLDTTSMQITNVVKNNAEFGCTVSSGGSMCGGRYLNECVKDAAERFMEKDLPDILKKMTEGGTQTMEKNDLLHRFDFENARQNFSAQFEEHDIHFAGPALPVDIGSFFSASSLSLPCAYMVEAHDLYLQRVYEHVDTQLYRTQKSLNYDNAPIELVFIGGVTQSEYIERKLRQKYEGKPNVAVVFVENFDRPLMAVGCILSGFKPEIGRRFASKEAYGTLVAKSFDAGVHESSNMVDTEDSTRGKEARNLIDWIVQIDDEAKQRTRVHDLSWAFVDDHSVPMLSDPRLDSTNFPFTFTQTILSTTDRRIADEQDIEYKGISSFEHIEQRQQLQLSISKAECEEIHNNYFREAQKGDLTEDEVKNKMAANQVGFWQDAKTGCWFFGTEVKIIVDWPDLQMSWEVEIPRCGYHEDEAVSRYDVIEKTVTFATINHGVSNGDTMVIDDVEGR